MKATPIAFSAASILIISLVIIGIFKTGLAAALTAATTTDATSTVANATTAAVVDASSTSASTPAMSQATTTAPVTTAKASLKLVHAVGNKYVDYFTDGTKTYSFPGDPAVDANLNKPNAPTPKHGSLQWVSTAGMEAYDTTSGDLEAGDYAKESDGSFIYNMWTRIPTPPQALLSIPTSASPKPIPASLPPPHLHPQANRVERSDLPPSLRRPIPARR